MNQLSNINRSKWPATSKRKMIIIRIIEKKDI